MFRYRRGASAVAVTASVAGRPESLRGVPETHIFGAEIVAPLRDAMGFVHREQFDPAAVEQFQRIVAQQALGRDVEQPQPVDQPLINSGALGGVAAGAGFD